MKVSFICTVFNESHVIEKLLDSLMIQTRKPDEIIIVDGGSTDKTKERIEEWKEKNNIHNLTLLVKRGNRSVGRNEAIIHANGDVIAISDAGCILKHDWLEQITKPFSDPSLDVVAGYYKGRGETTFQKCLIPYVLVMPDRVKKNKFLPATRSMAVRKNVFETIGLFPEEYSHNEDYVFAKRLEREKKRIIFVEEAIVTWIPPKSFKKSFIMFYRFALGDIESGILRKKVIALFGRYILAIVVFALYLKTSQIEFLYMLLGGLVLYCIWAIGKNYKHVQEKEAIFILPILQIYSDIAVLSGSIRGGVKKYGI